MQSGRADVVVAGGTESMSLVPMGGHKVAPNPSLLERYPDVYLGMGLTAENVAQKYGIDREQSDALRARRRTRRRSAAIDAGKFKDEIVPLSRSTAGENGSASHASRSTSTRARARDTTLAALAKLKPAFAEGGIVTAGNASQMSDGAAAAVVMSAEKARELGLTPLARFVSFAVAGVPPEIMGIGPVEAIPQGAEAGRPERSRTSTSSS